MLIYEISHVTFQRFSTQKTAIEKLHQEASPSLLWCCCLFLCTQSSVTTKKRTKWVQMVKMKKEKLLVSGSPHLMFSDTKWKWEKRRRNLLLKRAKIKNPKVQLFLIRSLQGKKDEKMRWEDDNEGNTVSQSGRQCSGSVRSLHYHLFKMRPIFVVLFKLSCLLVARSALSSHLI